MILMTVHFAEKNAAPSPAADECALLAGINTLFLSMKKVGITMSL